MILLFAIKILSASYNHFTELSKNFPLESTNINKVPDDFLDLIIVENACVVKEILYTYCDRMKEIIYNFIENEKAFRTLCNESFRLTKTYFEDIKNFSLDSFHNTKYKSFIEKHHKLLEINESKWEIIILDILSVFYYHANTKDIQYFIKACRIRNFDYQTCLFSEDECLLIQFVPEFLDTRIQTFMIMRGNQSICLKFDNCITNFLIDAIVSHSFNKL